MGGDKVVFACVIVFISRARKEVGYILKQKTVCVCVMINDVGLDKTD